ncbi:MAG: transcription repressor NadR [Oscillospiraceae bacterium]
MKIGTGKRREKIISILSESDQAVSASALAQRLHVSRQVIVGDIALLRAQGHEILSTPRGYVINSRRAQEEFVFKIACSHDGELTRDELYAIVDNGGEVLDVIVEHPVYGQLTGQLNISSRYDVDMFLRKVEEGEAALLCDLTGGIHLHTISCRDQQAADRIRKVLREMNISLDSA